MIGKMVVGGRLKAASRYNHNRPLLNRLPLTDHRPPILMQQRRIIIPNRLGLHARAAAKLVRLANTFDSSITLSRCDATAKNADAKSILGLLLLVATQHTEIEMAADGRDESAALAALCQLIEEKFGERE